MPKNSTSYIKTDDNRIINEKCIRWVKKMSDCLHLCTFKTPIIDVKKITKR